MSIRIPLAAAALLCVCLVFVNSVKASSDPLAGGATELTLDRGFARTLAADGVRVSATAGARARGLAYVLPVTGGSIDPTAGKGEVENAGTLVFVHGRRRVVVRDVVVKTKREPLIAKVGGSQLKVASAARVSFLRAGFGSVVSAGPIRLTAKFATRLGKKLRLHGVFSAGQVLGSLRSEAEPLTLAVLPEGRVTLNPDPAFLAKLEARFVSLNPIAPAERAPGPLFTFPLGPAGTIAVSGSSGVVRSGGALEFLQLGAGQVFWQEPWFDLAGAQVLAEADIEPTPAFPGKAGQVPIASLAAGSVSADPAARTVGIDGAVLALSATGASELNQAFAGGKEAFVAGETIGRVSFTARTH